MTTSHSKPVSKYFHRPLITMGTDALWLAVILAGFLFIISLIPLPPNDFWWHLKIGEWIFSHKTVPTTQMFAWTLPADHPFFYGTWLAEWLLFILYRVGRLDMLIFTRTFLAGVSFWLVGHEARQRSGSWRIAAFVVALGCAMCLNNLIVRTQIWAWVPFMLFCILLRKFADKKIRRVWLLLLPVLMAFWVNTHGSFVLGLVLIGIYFAGESLRSILKLPGALIWKDDLWIGIIGLLTALSTLINPRTTQIFSYVLDLMTDRSSQQLVVEWQSPTPQGIANVVFYLSILVLLATLTYSRYRPSPTTLLTILGFLWLAWSGQRYVIWYAFLVMPILAQAIVELPLKIPKLEVQIHWKNVLIAGIIFIPVILAQPWFAENFPLPDSYWKQVLRNTPEGPLLSTETPVAAVSYLKDHPGGKLFNEMGYGSYLIWKLPEQGVFIDPRVELYPFAQWQDYIAISHGTRLLQLTNQYSIDRFLISRELQKDLSGALASDPAWQLEYQDAYAEIWTKALKISEP